MNSENFRKVVLRQAQLNLERLTPSVFAGGAEYSIMGRFSFLWGSINLKN
jgi:hypothetical protein